MRGAAVYWPWPWCVNARWCIYAYVYWRFPTLITRPIVMRAGGRIREQLRLGPASQKACGGSGGKGPGLILNTGTHSGTLEI